jgi:hypothetical protein
MTLQTDIAQIKALSATYAKEMAELCDKMLADNPTPAPDVVVTEPEPTDPVPPSPASTTAISGSMVEVPVYSTGLVRYVGDEKKYVGQSIVEAFQAVAQALNRDFPIRIDARLEVIKGSPRTGTIVSPEETHPPGSSAFDLSYFTFTRNHTQYTASGGAVTALYDDDGNLTVIFDAERMLACLKMFKVIFPNFTCIVGTKIKTAMGADKINWISGSDSLNHPLHPHCQPSGSGVIKINTGAVI